MSGAPLKSWKEIPIAGVPWMFSTEYKTGDWRSMRPIIDQNKCVKCLTCYIFCPEMAIIVEWEDKTKNKVARVEINYDYCKGCGICAEECPVKAIHMELEKR